VIQIEAAEHAAMPGNDVPDGFRPAAQGRLAAPLHTLTHCRTFAIVRHKLTIVFATLGPALKRIEGGETVVAGRSTSCLGLFETHREFHEKQ
jgi:hypothetical protein